MRYELDLDIGGSSRQPKLDEQGTASIWTALPD